jgi:hypothetical protein
MTENRVVKAADSWLGLVFGIFNLFMQIFVVCAIIYIISYIPFVGNIKDWLFEGSTVGTWLYERSIDLLNWLF